jgi:hypothetical protein
VQARIEILGQRANQGNLNASERCEYEALIKAADFIAILKLKAAGVSTKILADD